MPVSQSHKEKRTDDHTAMPEVGTARWGLGTALAGGAAGELQMLSSVVFETSVSPSGGPGMNWSSLLVFLQIYDQEAETATSRLQPWSFGSRTPKSFILFNSDAEGIS